MLVISPHIYLPRLILYLFGIIAHSEQGYFRFELTYEALNIHKSTKQLMQ